MRPVLEPALRSRRASLVSLAVAFAYAVLRYNVFKAVAWERLPLYVLNKAVAWASIFLFAVAAFRGWRGRSEWTREPEFAQGSWLAGAHVLMSLIVLRAAEYPDLFESSGIVQPGAAMALLAGVFAAVLVGRGRRAGSIGVAMPVAVLAHAALLGYGSWLSPAQWPGFMVPITLWSALASLAAAVLVWANRGPSKGS